MEEKVKEKSLFCLLCCLNLNSVTVKFSWKYFLKYVCLYYRPEISLRTEAFISTCSNEEATCNVVNQHINSQWDENEVAFVSPNKCGKK